MSDGFWYGLLDFLTLAMLLAAGVELAVIGLFGFSVLTWLFGSGQRIVYDAMGFAAIWQLIRQRFS
jgi:uncharacterized membrane protein YuzA (DUF378 family)